MDVTPLIRPGQQVIQNYAGGVFRISGKIYEGAVIVTPDAAFAWDVAENFSDLTAEHFAPLAGVDVLLLGTGGKMHFLPPPLRKALKEQGLSPDVMDTGAACRTYNVLMAEGRRVAAALLPYNK